MITPIPLNHSLLQTNSQSLTYEGIETNSNQILDLIKQLDVRGERVEKQHERHVSKFFRTLQSNRKEANIKLNQYLVENTEMKKSNVINLGSKKCSSSESHVKIKDPLRAKDGLRTGLTKDRKTSIRNEKDKYGQAKIKKQKTISTKKTANELYLEKVEREANEQQQIKHKEEESKQFEELLDDTKHQAWSDIRAPNETCRKLMQGNLLEQLSVSHLAFIALLEENVTFEFIINFLANKYQPEVLKYTEQNFRILMKLCTDKRALIKLINGWITFDQFVVKINCQTQDVHYRCKDDLLAGGIRKEFFDNLKETGKQIKAIHNVNRISDIKPDQLADNNSDTFERIPEYSDLTDEKIRAIYQKEFDNNAWKSNKHCLKSIFSIIPDEIKERKIAPNNLQKFSTRPRFKYQRNFAHADKLKSNMTIDCNQEIPLFAKNRNSAMPSRNGNGRARSCTSTRAKTMTPGTIEKEETKNQTRLSIMFIRAMKEQGETIIYDADQDLRMMYEEELKRHHSELQQQIFDSKGGKKKRPTEIMNPQTKMESKDTEEPFDKYDFLANLNQKLLKTKRKVDADRLKFEESNLYQMSQAITVVSGQTKPDTYTESQYQSHASLPARRPRLQSAAVRFESNNPNLSRRSILIEASQTEVEKEESCEFLSTRYQQSILNDSRIGSNQNILNLRSSKKNRIKSGHHDIEGLNHDYVAVDVDDIKPSYYRTGKLSTAQANGLLGDMSEFAKKHRITRTNSSKPISSRKISDRALEKKENFGELLTGISKQKKDNRSKTPLVNRKSSNMDIDHVINEQEQKEGRTHRRAKSIVSGGFRMGKKRNSEITKSTLASIDQTKKTLDKEIEQNSNEINDLLYRLAQQQVQQIQNKMRLSELKDIDGTLIDDSIEHDQQDIDIGTMDMEQDLDSGKEEVSFSKGQPSPDVNSRNVTSNFMKVEADSAPNETLEMSQKYPDLSMMEIENGTINGDYTPVQNVRGDIKESAWPREGEQNLNLEKRSQEMDNFFKYIEGLGIKINYQTNLSSNTRSRHDSDGKAKITVRMNTTEDTPSPQLVEREATAAAENKYSVIFLSQKNQLEAEEHLKSLINSMNFPNPNEQPSTGFAEHHQPKILSGDCEIRSGQSISNGERIEDVEVHAMSISDDHSERKGGTLEDLESVPESKLISKTQSEERIALAHINSNANILLVLNENNSNQKEKIFEFINHESARGEPQLVKTILETQIKQNGMFAKASPTILRKKITVGDQVSRVVGMQMRNYSNLRLQLPLGGTDEDGKSTLPRSTKAFAPEPEKVADLSVAGQKILDPQSNDYHISPSMTLNGKAIRHPQPKPPIKVSLFKNRVAPPQISKFNYRKNKITSKVYREAYIGKQDLTAKSILKNKRGVEIKANSPLSPYHRDTRESKIESALSSLEYSPRAQQAALDILISSKNKNGFSKIQKKQYVYKAKFDQKLMKSNNNDLETVSQNALSNEMSPKSGKSSEGFKYMNMQVRF